MNVTVVYSCPAFDCWLPERATPHLTAREAVAIFPDESYRGNPATASVNSVISYALEEEADPIQWLDQARAKHEELHWINLEALSLTSHQQTRRKYTALHVGQIVIFEGQWFRIDKAPNRNFKFTPIKV